MSAVVIIGSLGPFPFREAYGYFLNRHIRLYGSWYTTPHALMHLLSFGTLGATMCLISERWSIRAVGIAGVILLGLAIERLQLIGHPGSPFEFWDLRDDAFGTCLGVLLAFLARKGNVLRAVT